MTHIWVPKLKIIEPKSPVLTRARVSGWFKLDAIRPDGRTRPLTGWFPNIITNGGLNRIGTVADYLAACRVGSGSSTPAATDTNLQSHVAGTSTVFSSNNAAQASPPYYASHTRVYRFATGVAAGNLQEIGIATQAANASGILFSRALILDGSGNPTTITVLSDEVLDCTYQCRLYPPLGDVNGTVNIGGVDIDYTCRAMAVTDFSFWCLPAHAGSGGLNSARFGDGAIGTITGSPTGSSALLNAAASAYADGTLTRQTTVTAGLTEANFAGGIDWAWACFGSPGGNSALGTTQVGFSPAIAKDNTKTLSLVFENTWARGTV